MLGLYDRTWNFRQKKRTKNVPRQRNCRRFLLLVQPFFSASFCLVLHLVPLGVGSFFFKRATNQNAGTASYSMDATSFSESDQSECSNGVLHGGRDLLRERPIRMLERRPTRWTRPLKRATNQNARTASYTVDATLS